MENRQNNFMFFSKSFLVILFKFFIIHKSADGFWLGLTRHHSFHEWGVFDNTWKWVQNESTSGITYSNWDGSRVAKKNYKNEKKGFSN